MPSDKRTSTAIAAGQVASALIGFALGAVVTLLAVVHWSSPHAPAQQVAAAPVPPAAQPPAAPPPAAVPAPSPPAVAAVPAPPQPDPAPQAAAPPQPAAPAEASPPAAAVPQDPPAEKPAAESKSAAQPVKPKPQAPRPSAGRVRYVVQAGSFISDAIAQKLADQLTGHDHPADITVRTDGSGRTWHVVRLSETFATHEEAAQLSGTLKRDEDIDTLVIRLAPAPKAAETPQ